MHSNYFNGGAMNSTDLLINREYGYIDSVVNRRFQNAVQFIDRLELETVLEGHNGCVNCLEWSSNGKILASGSDDTHLMLWDPFRKKCLLSLLTPHTGNMFSVKFLPQHNNSLIATAAADKMIYVFDVNRQKGPIWVTDAHTSRVKRLATAPDMPYVFWSAGEDGNVLQFDIRVPYTTNSQVLLINMITHIGMNAEAKCIAVNPRRSEYVAVGANDPFARIYDRRMIRLDVVETKLESLLNSNALRDSLLSFKCATFYCPGHKQLQAIGTDENDSKAITYLTFNPEGNELLVNMGGEHIYLYDLINNEKPVYLNLPEFKPEANETEEQNQAKRKLPEHVEIFKKMGNEFLENEKYLRAIDQYTAAIRIAPNSPVMYLNRATAYMRRLWYGDIYAALRDCNSALKLDPSYVKAHFRLARALLELGKPDEANECLKELICRFPTYVNNHGVSMLKKDISEHSQNDNSMYCPRISENETYWRSTSKDYKERFVGHCNTTTDIKEANYFGPDGKFIVAGSDDGNIFIWERGANIYSVYKGDMTIVNCVQPHPDICMMATSGIDHDIKIWSPMADVSEEKSNRVPYIDGIVESNQNKMKADPFEFNAPNTFCRSS